MTDKLAYLDNLDIFKSLTPEELEALASITEEYRFDEGAVVAYQRDPADEFYIVKEGRLFAKRVGEGGAVRHSQAYSKGDYFDDVWLFTPHTHDATIRATEEGRLLIIKRDDFLEFLQAFPGALSRLAPAYTDQGEYKSGLSTEAWREAQKSQIGPTRHRYARRVGLSPDELVEYATRRSPWLLVLNILPYFLLFLILLGAYYYLRASFPQLVNPTVSLVVPIFLLLTFLLVVAYLALDWSNDYFIITNRHVMHYEFSLSLAKYGSRVMKLPIDRVQSVEVERPNLVANLLNVGAVRITTAAQKGVMRFDYLADPGLARDTIIGLTQQIKQLDASQEQAVMRRSLEQHFQTDPAYERIDQEQEQEAMVEGNPVVEEKGRRKDGARPFARNAAKSRTTFLGRLLRRYSYRVVEGDVVTYRKHVFVLLEVSRWPLLIGSILFLFYAILTYFFPGSRSGMVLGVLFAAVLLDLLWLTWQVEDWRNDAFQLTKEYVIDIDRSPFGTGESRKQAELENIQNISSDRPGLLPTIFNYGNVYIETAGATADITFENVVNPNQVQRDIFERQEQLRREERRRESERRRKELALMIDVYQQAQEQGRIPRRTPPVD
ncbi:MAG: cyclic nucleotide-binding domain-containing protein [Candidatus Promineifilaceae bacterium]|nr:cyclic nucleotide-binding domain-containing protein [Candidatus Promineifilaceae bacterium]